MSQLSRYDDVLVEIVRYVEQDDATSDLGLSMARICLLDSMGCAIRALGHESCQRMLGSHVGYSQLPDGFLIPSTPYRLHLLEAVFSLATMIRWLDYNDTWLAKEWGHPSDNLSGLLMMAQYLNQRDSSSAWTIGRLLPIICKAYEIQGVLALDNAFNEIGLDHVILVKVATSAVIAHMLGLDSQQIANAVSQSWLDGQALRTYRHAPSTGSRKCWAAADAASRGVQMALISQRGEPGYPQVLSAPRWGFHDVYQLSKPISISRPFSNYVIENILFKVAYPAEFHAQTLIECAIQLRAQIVDRIPDIQKIVIRTHEAADRIINKVGPLQNPSDRDHCLQYICAIALLFGDVTDEHYLDQHAAHPDIDHLRGLMCVTVDPCFTKDYLDPSKRSIANALQIVFMDGTHTDDVVAHYPLGHKQRRSEAQPLLRSKCRNNIEAQLHDDQIEHVMALFDAPTQMDEMSVEHFLQLFHQEKSV